VIAKGQLAGHVKALVAQRGEKAARPRDARKRHDAPVARIRRRSRNRSNCSIPARHHERGGNAERPGDALRLG
jgi:hypothetical protein